MAPKVALVLGAGGIAGGAFHAGALAALQEETGWDARAADVIVGTSAGSITGATLRVGLAATDLFARAVGAPLSREGTALLARLGAQPPTLPTMRSLRRDVVGRVREAAASGAAR